MFTVVYDACVLSPAPLRDLLVRIAARGLVRARWSDEILDECFAASGGSGRISRRRRSRGPAG